jgi:hypothetical protein
MFSVPWEFVILIIISTSGQISVLLPELDIDPSRREATSLKFIENFTLVQTYNVNTKSATSIHAGMFPSENIKDWNEFLESNIRKEEFFKFGRPLIYGTFVNNVGKKLYTDEYDLHATLEDCREFKFLSQKLFGGKEYEKNSKDISQLCGMFNFAFGVNFLPPQVKKEELVDKYLMTLVKYLDEGGSCYLAGCYLPEGAFNSLSAIYFVQNPSSLEDILSTCIKYGICHVGNLGEILSQYILLRTAFKFIDDSVKKIRRMIFQPVFLYDFLLHLAGKKENAIEEFFIENPEFDKSRISFSYFEPFLKNPILRPYDLMARCLFKGSALTLNSLHRGIDLMIPLVLKDGTISFLGIQVKFVEEGSLDGTIEGAIPKMEFNYMFFARKGEEKLNNDRPFGLIILALGDYDYGKTTIYRRPREAFYDAPSVIIFSGTPESFKSEVGLIRMAPEGLTTAYRGVNPTYFQVHDRLEELTTDIPEELIIQKTKRLRLK